LPPPPTHSNDGDDDGHHHPWRVLFKTLAWLLFAGLAVLGFAACMTHRYRIYYYLRGLWYTFLRLECTQWILHKLRLERFFFGGGGSGGGGGGRGSNYTSLNEIIFDTNLGDLQEGLLMRETLG
jgi:hypothetical protein